MINRSFIFENLCDIIYTKYIESKKRGIPNGALSNYPQIIILEIIIIYGIIIIKTFIYKEICKEKMWKLNANEKLGITFDKIRRWWNNKEEIDLVGINSNGEDIILE